MEQQKRLHLTYSITIYLSAYNHFILFYNFSGMVSVKAPPLNPDVLQWPPPAHPKRHIFG